MFSLWYLQMMGYIMACRSCSFACRLHHLIFIIKHNLGIRDKLLHLFRNWLLGSRGVVLYDGHLSEPLGITQGIKQGGELSMFLFTVAVMDIHDYVDQASDGLCVAGMKLGSLAYADDIVLLSNSKSGLIRMMY